MALRESKGNMYNFITHTWNPIKGICQHDCSYCYMKRFKQNDIRIEFKELNIDLGENNYIFVGSGIDIFASNIPPEWIELVLHKMNKYKNKYLLQSKNPMRMLYYIDKIPHKTIFCTTIESDKTYPEIMNKSPAIAFRYSGIKTIKNKGKRIMITIEPILNFDVLEFSSMLISLHPEQINIGADSGKNNLPEPASEKIYKLIENLERQKIKVIQKNNLKRILKERN